MKKIITGMAFSFALILAANAEIVTRMPVAQSPDLSDNTKYAVEAGAARGMDATFVGGRATFHATESTELFVGVGVVDLEDADSDGAIFGGGIFKQLKMDAPFLVGLRGSFDFAQTDSDIAEYDFWVLSALVVIGGETGWEGFDWYANLGFVHQDGDFELDVPGPAALEGEFDSETEFQFGAGATYDFTETLSIYGAFDVVAGDDLFLSTGLRLAL